MQPEEKYYSGSVTQTNVLRLFPETIVLLLTKTNMVIAPSTITVQKEGQIYLAVDRFLDVYTSHPSRY